MCNITYAAASLSVSVRPDSDPPHNEMWWSSSTACSARSGEDSFTHYPTRERLSTADIGLKCHYGRDRILLMMIEVYLTQWSIPGTLGTTNRVGARGLHVLCTFARHRWMGSRWNSVYYPHRDRRRGAMRGVAWRGGLPPAPADRPAAGTTRVNHSSNIDHERTGSWSATTFKYLDEYSQWQPACPPPL